MTGSIQNCKHRIFISIKNNSLCLCSLRAYNQAFRAVECPLESYVATIDGTKHCFSAPGHNFQEACYCGHWHEHAMSYQFLQLPNGLHLTFGPFNGNIIFALMNLKLLLEISGFEHDSTCVKLIDLEERLCEKFNGNYSVIRQL